MYPQRASCGKDNRLCRHRRRTLDLPFTTTERALPLRSLQGAHNGLILLTFSGLYELRSVPPTLKSYVKRKLRPGGRPALFLYL
jgi:hypothetical protein